MKLRLIISATIIATIGLAFHAMADEGSMTSHNLTFNIYNTPCGQTISFSLIAADDANNESLVLESAHVAQGDSEVVNLDLANNAIVLQFQSANCQPGQRYVVKAKLTAPSNLQTAKLAYTIPAGVGASIDIGGMGQEELANSGTTDLLLTAEQ